MIIALLICIVLLMFKPIRTIVGWGFIILAGLMWWHWPSEQEMAAQHEAPTPAVVREAEPVPEPPQPLPQIRNGAGIDYGPAPPFVGPRQPRPYRQQ